MLDAALSVSNETMVQMVRQGIASLIVAVRVQIGATVFLGVLPAASRS